MQDIKDSKRSWNVTFTDYASKPLSAEQMASYSKYLKPATHYQVDLTGTPDQVRLSGLPDSMWLALQ
jgi:hypothetical protein